MTSRSIFDHESYKKYLIAILHKKQGAPRGARTRLAEFLRCNTTYLSQVLNGAAHLSLEQAERANHYFHHSSEESHFFLLLVQLERAGTPELQSRFQTQVNEIIEKRANLKSRLEFSRTISNEEQARYYSAWYYTAVHFLITMPAFQTPEAISSYLNLPIARIKEVLEFLSSRKLAIEKKGTFRCGTLNIHLGNDSPMLAKHHTNWRMRAIADLDRGAGEEHLHYSSVVTLDRKDLPKARELLVAAIEEIRKLVRDSKENSLCCYSLDLFEVGNQKTSE